MPAALRATSRRAGRAQKSWLPSTAIFSSAGTLFTQVVQLVHAALGRAEEHVVAPQQQDVGLGLAQEVEGVVQGRAVRGRAEVEVGSEGQLQRRAARLRPSASSCCSSRTFVEAGNSRHSFAGHPPAYSAARTFSIRRWPAVVRTALAGHRSSVAHPREAVAQ